MPFCKKCWKMHEPSTPHPGPIMRSQCYVCGKGFDWGGGSKHHLGKSECKPPGKIHSCRKCGQQFSDVNIRNKHTRKKCNNKRYLGFDSDLRYCRHCKYLFENSSDFQQHFSSGHRSFPGGEYQESGSRNGYDGYDDTYGDDNHDNTYGDDNYDDTYGDDDYDEQNHNQNNYDDQGPGDRTRLVYNDPNYEKLFDPRSPLLAQLDRLRITGSSRAMPENPVYTPSEGTMHTPSVTSVYTPSASNTSYSRSIIYDDTASSSTGWSDNTPSQDSNRSGNGDEDDFDDGPGEGTLTPRPYEHTQDNITTQTYPESDSYTHRPSGSSFGGYSGYGSLQNGTYNPSGSMNSVLHRYSESYAANNPPPTYLYAPLNSDNNQDAKLRRTPRASGHRSFAGSITFCELCNFHFQNEEALKTHNRFGIHMPTAGGPNSVKINSGNNTNFIPGPVMFNPLQAHLGYNLGFIQGLMMCNPVQVNPRGMFSRNDSAGSTYQSNQTPPTPQDPDGKFEFSTNEKYYAEKPKPKLDARQVAKESNPTKPNGSGRNKYGERPCPLCGKIFKTENSLKSHLKSGAHT